MSREVLVAENLGKAYCTFRSEMHRFARWFGIKFEPTSEQWVLRHVSFRMRAGEAIGIVGQNGAGKSTLLKLITGTTRPNEGQVLVDGRVSALLELGLGFNPELSGRENVIHAAGLMGLAQDQILRCMPDIEAFAEIGEYFDRPVRTYSSGMQMRVAFSAATAVRPDILIVDEALAVGDAYFVHKSFKRILDFRDAGTSLLIVSHDPTAIRSLCSRAILLEQGKIIVEGDPKEVLDYYNALISEKENKTVRVRKREASVATESGTGEAGIEFIDLVNASGEAVEHVGVGDSVTLVVRARVHAPIEKLVFGYMIRDRLGQPVYGTNTNYTDQELVHLSAGDVIEFTAKFDASLGPGTYSVSIALTSTETHLVNNYQWKDLALLFTVANIRHPTFVGVAYIPAQISHTITFGAVA